MNFLRATPAILITLIGNEAQAQRFWPAPNLPVYSLPAVVRAYDPAARSIELRLESGRVVRSSLAGNWRMMLDGELASRDPEVGERLFVQANEPHFPVIIALWDPLTFCAYGRRTHHTGEVRFPEPNILEVTSGSRFTRRRRTVSRFDITPRTQFWLEGRRVPKPAALPPFSDLEVVIDPDGAVFAVFDTPSWRTFAATELRRTADRIAFLK
ncbi:MAG: hypothetical protein ACO1SX_17530 [Actinomycetota bacterium]